MRYILLLTLIASLTLAGCAETPLATTTPVATEAPPAAAVAATVVEYIELWGLEGLDSRYAVLGDVEGTCQSGSIRAARADAWRCAVAPDGPAFDPCLENPFDAQSPLACYAPDGITLLRPGEPLPREAANPPGAPPFPLTLTLANGDECELAADAAGGQPAQGRYACRSGAVAGRPDESAAVWTARYDPGGAGEVATVNVTTARVFRDPTAALVQQTLDAAGPLLQILPDRRPGFTRLVFYFGEGGLPGYDIRYATEPATDATGAPLALDGSAQLRIRFLYPGDDVPTFAGEQRVAIAPEGNVNEMALASTGNGDQVWYVGLDQAAGFRVRPSDSGTELLVDIYDPQP